MTTLRIESAVCKPKYNNDGGGAGFIDVRSSVGQLIRLHVDGSIASIVAREQVIALCAVAGIGSAEAKSLAEKADAMIGRSLDANRSKAATK